MQRLNRFYLSMLFAAGLQAAAASAAPGAHGPDGEHLTTSPETRSPLGRQADGSVVLPMAQQRLFEIRTQLGVSSTAALTRQLHAVVQSHPAGRGLVQANSAGRLAPPANGLPVAGQRVQAGQILGYLYYQDTAYEQASQLAELTALRLSASQTERDVKRLQQLSDLVAQQQLEQLQLQLNSLRQQIRQLEGGLEQPEVLTAPLSGIVQPHQLSSGQWLAAGQPLFEILDPALLLLDARTTEPALLNQIGHAYLQGWPQATLEYIGSTGQYQQGSLSLQFKLTQAPLAVGQPVTLVVAQAGQLSGIRLPASAVVSSSQNLPQVWIKLSAERFLPQIVRYMPLNDTEVLITAGLGADNRVVVQGANLLNQIR
ncbi:membrane protein [Alishewanella sp. WH16-1]|uniref:efflux RND transporter periplasmic adaptor subunit n=1 Tax=Alishewanella sp. WH16-1 TaxID=1651088 RepID=UPI00070B8CBE|nr:HlyD family efflux transporter periplasmic adaptor subunit [Alishewanella sp. WH16-1]KRS20530.1 membrane protein [Alishewanella sp. WH16-1]